MVKSSEKQLHDLAIICLVLFLIMFVIRFLGIKATFNHQSPQKSQSQAQTLYYIENEIDNGTK